MTPIQVVHVGLAGDRPGGMAQVVNGLLTWQDRDVQSVAAVTTRYRRDPLAPLLWGKTVIRIITRRLRRRHCVVSVHLSERGSFVREGAVLIMASALGLPTVAHMHGAHFGDFVQRHAITARVVLRHADAVIALTEDTRQAIQNLTAGDVSVFLIPNAVEIPDGERLAPSDKAKRIVFAGELSRRKGFDSLLQAWSHIRLSCKGWSLHAYGPDVEGLARESDGSADVHFYGAVPHVDIQRALRACAIAVLPSTHEALPMFVLEAMAAGCAVVCTPVGQMGAVVDESQAGLLTPVGDAHSLGEALRSLVQDDARREAMSNRATMAAVTKFSHAAVRPQLLAVYREAQRIHA